MFAISFNAGNLVLDQVNKIKVPLQDFIENNSLFKFVSVKLKLKLFLTTTRVLLFKHGFPSHSLLSEID